MKSVATIIFIFFVGNAFAQNHSETRRLINKNQNKLSFWGDTSNVLATKFVIVDKDVITHAEHNLDGSWSFWSNHRRYVPETALKKVRFKSLFKRDNSISQVSKMPRGYWATRESRTSPWVIEKFRYKD